MDQKTFDRLENWFEAYVASFASSDPSIQRQMDLKKYHSWRVCREMADIGSDLGLAGRDLYIARAAGLFHDIGRFEQFVRYRTFADGRSVNHALLGTEILEKNRVLASLEKSVQELLLKVIAFHNRAALPKNETSPCLFLSRLLRDADKLDIWGVLTDYYKKGPDKEKDPAIELDLPDTPGISAEIYQCLLNGSPIVFDSMRNLNDFKLLQAGWVYDINFHPTFSRLKQRGYLRILEDSLSRTREVREIFNTLTRYVDKQLAVSFEPAFEAGLMD